ncbi:TetR family transcriptional regulator [Stackebrandtia soli]|uniref:TetR family transcriptional regulator n=1 Tax=Stackebrandtia soli TaxID=1892856 RepID=UPI0039ED234D
MRRRPVQQRSTERVTRMLDACAELLDEVGYTKLTTTLIANRADVAIGSVYQFFGDKRAVVRALGMRHLEVFFESLATHIAQRQPAHWWDLVDIAIDEYIAMHRSEPGFRTTHFGDAVDINLLDDSRTNNDVLTDRIERLLDEHFNIGSPRGLDMALTVAVETADALIKLAFRRDPDGDPALLAEAKKIIRQYLATYVQDRDS